LTGNSIPIISVGTAALEIDRSLGGPIGSAFARGTASLYINFGMSGWTVETLDAMVMAEIEALTADPSAAAEGGRSYSIVQATAVGEPHVKHLRASYGKSERAAETE
jgi:hypothetical protein